MLVHVLVSCIADYIEGVTPCEAECSSHLEGRGQGLERGGRGGEEVCASVL